MERAVETDNGNISFKRRRYDTRVEEPNVLIYEYVASL